MPFRTYIDRKYPDNTYYDENYYVERGRFKPLLPVVPVSSSLKPSSRTSSRRPSTASTAIGNSKETNTDLYNPIFVINKEDQKTKPYDVKN